VNPLTRLWRRTLECVGHWIIDEEQLHRTRRNVLDTSAHRASVDVLRPRANAMLEQTAQDECSAAVCAAIEIMRNSQVHTRPLGGPEPAAPFSTLTREEERIHAPRRITGRRIRLGQNEVGVEKLSWLIVLVLVAVSGVVALEYVKTQAIADQNERALALVTANDVTPIHLAAGPGVPAGAQGTYWGQVGANIAVLDISDLQPTPLGTRYRWWVEYASHWTSIGIARPDATGSARLIAEGPELATPPDALQVTREPDDGSQTPMVSGVLIWPAR
jgi:Anti-sigma-K factor rskA